MVIGSIIVAAETEFEMQLDGISNTEGLQLIVAGDLFVDSQVQSDSVVFFTVGGSVTQSATGTITAEQLGLAVGVETILASNNDVNIVAASNAGQTLFNDIDELEIGTVAIAANTDFEIQATGITTLNSDVKINATGNLTIEQQVATGTGSFFVVANGDVQQSATGIISTNQLGLMVQGQTTLDSLNDVNTFAAANNGLTIFNDDNDLTIGTTIACLLYTSPSPRDQRGSRMPSSA